VVIIKGDPIDFGPSLEDLFTSFRYAMDPDIKKPVRFKSDGKVTKVDIMSLERKEYDEDTIKFKGYIHLEITTPMPIMISGEYNTTKRTGHFIENLP